MSDEIVTPDEPLYNVAQTAARVGISRGHLSRLIGEGRIRYRAVGRHKRFTDQHIQLLKEYLEFNPEQAAAVEPPRLQGATRRRSA